jgi:long-chain acyl-CoA synthetase
MPVPVMEKFNSLSSGANIVEGFGLTEASPITHLNPLRGNSKNGSIGLPFPDTDAAIVDMEVGSVPLPAGKIGELVIRGPQVMQGYWKRPDETASVLRNGWLYTGDIAYMDEEGYFFIVDRKKDLIITGGYNVYPREIDEVLHEHPAIKEAVSVGIKHPTRGEIIKAYIVLKEGETLSKTDVLAFCREKLANYKVPKQVEFRDDLPKSIVGKVLRRVIREEEDRRHSDGGEFVDDIEPGGDEDGMASSKRGKRDKRAKKAKKESGGNS